MNTINSDIIPITTARGTLGSLAEKVKGDNYIILTKGGKPKAALVDVFYLKKLEKDINNIYQKTYIDPKVLPLTREFGNDEIMEWVKEDKDE